MELEWPYVFKYMIFFRLTDLENGPMVAGEGKNEGKG